MYFYRKKIGTDHYYWRINNRRSKKRGKGQYKYISQVTFSVLSCLLFLLLIEESLKHFTTLYLSQCEVELVEVDPVEKVISFLFIFESRISKMYFKIRNNSTWILWKSMNIFLKYRKIVVSIHIWNFKWKKEFNSGMFFQVH